MNLTLLFANTSSHSSSLLFTLFIIFVSAKIAAEIFERLKQPAIVGEILAGIIIGPSLLKLVEPSEVTAALAEIGVILLLFMVGLETNIRALYKVGKQAILVALLGVIIPFISGWGLLKFLGNSNIQGAFLGAAMVATSVGITARVLKSMGVLNAKASQIILAAAIIDDILGLIVLSIVSSLSKGKVNYTELCLTITLAISFTVFVAYVGTKIVKKAHKTINQLQIGQAFFISAIALCLGLSWIGQLAGLAAIIGAFLAGMVINEISEGTNIEEQAGSIMEFTVPFFLVTVGLQIDFTVFKSSYVVTLVVITTIIAVLTKIVGCGIPILLSNKRMALQVGMGMVPRGEVGIIVAQYGLKHTVLSKELYSIMICMAVATTLIAPPFLAYLFKSEREYSMIPKDLEVVDPSQQISDLQ